MTGVQPAFELALRPGVGRVGLLVEEDGRAVRAELDALPVRSAGTVPPLFLSLLDVGDRQQKSPAHDGQGCGVAMTTKLAEHRLLVSS